MSHRHPRLVAALLAVTVALTWPAAALAQDTSAVAVNTKDDSSVFRLAFQIRRTLQSVVDGANAAVAVSSCTDCRTVAVAFQVVLAMGEVDQLTTTNLALAYNLDCTRCDSAAFAYQFVEGTGQIVHFTAEGNRRLAELRRRLQALRGAGLSDTELNAELDAIANELASVLAGELVAAGPPAHVPAATATPEAAATDPATPTATPEAAATDAATPTAAPDATATPDSTPAPAASTEPTATPTPTPSDTATPDATPTPAATPTPTPSP